MARYAGLLQPPAEGFSLGQRVFLPFGQKKTNYYDFLAKFRQFWFPVVTLVTLKKIQKVQKHPTQNLKKNQNITKKSEKQKKSRKIKKIKE